MAGPISPSQVEDTTPIPEEVWEIWNRKIEQNIEEGVATFSRAAIWNIITSPIALIYPKKDKYKYLEEEYRKAGWIVEVEKPYDSRDSDILIFKKP